MIRVQLPYHLRTLAAVGKEIEIEVAGPVVSQRTVLDAIEDRYPVLKGLIRDRVTKIRRPLVRFYACEQDLSHDPPDTLLPDEVVSGKEPWLIVGAIAGG